MITLSLFALRKLRLKLDTIRNMRRHNDWDTNKLYSVRTEAQMAYEKVSEILNFTNSIEKWCIEPGLSVEVDKPLAERIHNIVRQFEEDS